MDDSVWTKFDGIVLTGRDKDKISKGEMLDDLVINSVQILLKKNFQTFLGCSPLCFSQVIKVG